MTSSVAPSSPDSSSWSSLKFGPIRHYHLNELPAEKRDLLGTATAMAMPMHRRRNKVIFILPPYSLAIRRKDRLTMALMMMRLQTIYTHAQTSFVDRKRSIAASSSRYRGTWQTRNLEDFFLPRIIVCSATKWHL